MTDLPEDPIELADYVDWITHGTSPAPWEYEEVRGYKPEQERLIVRDANGEWIVNVAPIDRNPSDYQLLAAAREALPRLAEIVRDQQEEIERLREQVENCG